MLNRDTEVTVFYNDRRLKAIKEALAEKGSTVESELKDMMDVLYETVLPKEVCDEIDEQIAKDQAADDAEREASRRFAVMHIRETVRTPSSPMTISEPFSRRHTATAYTSEAN